MSPSEPAAECAWALEVILERRGRTAGPEEAERFRTHLERCSDCRRIRAADRRLAEALAGALLPPTPADFQQRVRALVRRRRRMRWLAAVGVAAAVLTGAVLLAVLGGIP
jgi:anti-sigma factor RsiW